jgi:hypothetical protein
VRNEVCTEIQYTNTTRNSFTNDNRTLVIKRWITVCAIDFTTGLYGTLGNAGRRWQRLLDGADGNQRRASPAATTLSGTQWKLHMDDRLLGAAAWCCLATQSTPCSPTRTWVPDRPSRTSKPSPAVSLPPAPVVAACPATCGEGPAPASCSPASAGPRQEAAGSRPSPAQTAPRGGSGGGGQVREASGCRTSRMSTRGQCGAAQADGCGVDCAQGCVSGVDQPVPPQNRRRLSGSSRRLEAGAYACAAAL